MDKGFTGIPNEVMAGLVSVRIPGEQAQCLMQIIRKTYGWGKPSDWICLKHFSHETGISRPSVIRAIKSLIEKRIIICEVKASGVKFYRVNESVEEWNQAAKKSGIYKNVNVDKNVNEPNKNVNDDLQKCKRPFTKMLPTKDNTTKDNITKETFTKEMRVSGLKKKWLDSFSGFWFSYPKKVNRKKAEFEWEKLFKKFKLKSEDEAKELAENIIKGLELYKQKLSRDGTEARYIKHGYGWLKEERWMDDYGETEKSVVSILTKKSQSTYDRLKDL